MAETALRLVSPGTHTRKVRQPLRVDRFLPRQRMDLDTTRGQAQEGGGRNKRSRISSMEGDLGVVAEGFMGQHGVQLLPDR